MQGLDDNCRGDVETFTRAILEPFRLRNVATVLLDHVTKNSGARGKFSIGSERKSAARTSTSASRYRPLRPRPCRALKIVTHKDRFGFLPRPSAAELKLRSDAETGAVTWDFRPVETPAGGWQPTALMERVSTFLEEQTEAVSRNVVEQSVKGRGNYVRQAIDELVAGGFVRETHGGGRTRLVVSTKPFRDGSSIRPGSSLVRPDDPSSLRPPLQGDERDGTNRTSC